MTKAVDGVKKNYFHPLSFPRKRDIQKKSTNDAKTKVIFCSSDIAPMQLFVFCTFSVRVSEPQHLKWAILLCEDGFKSGRIPDWGARLSKFKATTALAFIAKSLLLLDIIIYYEFKLNEIYRAILHKCYWLLCGFFFI